MNRYQEMYQQKKMTAEQALELIQDGDYMFSAQAAGEPQAILSKLQHLKKTGVKGTTLNTCLPLQYYDVMKDPDMKGIMEAQTARGVEFDAGGIVKKVRLMVPLCVPLLVSSVRKTNSAAIAAEVRGFNLRTSASGYKEYPFAALDVAALAGSVVLVAAAVALGVLL